jgi:hypothetical protein
MYYSFEEYADTYIGTYNECLFEIKKDVVETFERNDMYVRQDVIYFNNVSKVGLDYVPKRELKNIKMKLAEPLKYSYLMPPNALNKNENTGTCVDDAFLSTYPHISAEEFDRLCKEVEPDNKKEDGRSSAMLHHVCVTKDISMYAFDAKKRCFLKHLSKSQNYKALVYYCINNHMYHIIERDEVKSLVETAKAIETKINSDLFEQNESTNIFTLGLEIKENTAISTLLEDAEAESCIVIYDKHQINDQLIECHSLGLVPKVKKCKKTLITYMILVHPKNKDIKFYLFADQNKQAKYAEAGINYKTIMGMCKDHNIEFNNQTLPTLCRQLRDKVINEQNQRKKFTKDERIQFLASHPICQNEDCGIKLKMGSFEIDHIHPLSAGGSNDENNLQALCKNAILTKHKMKKRTMNI